MGGPNLTAAGIPGEAPTVDTFWEEERHWALADENPETATDDVILSAEEKFGIRLPELLKELYRRKNGGYTLFRIHPKVPEPRPGDDDWFYVCPDIYPVERLETLGEISDITDFGIEDQNFRNLFENADQLIIISRQGWDAMLCLDFRNPSGAPEVAYLEEIGGGNLSEVLRVPDFETFFAGLRRES